MERDLIFIEIMNLRIRSVDMRNIIMICMVTVLMHSAAKAQPHHLDVSVSFSFNELHEYGEWVSVGGYDRVWRPYAGPEWRPFKYGRWVWSSDGWLWESDEPYGWMVFHYGNWFYDDDWGWVWVPGYEWAPARVEWYVTDHEIGWAPLLPPAGSGHRVHAHVDWSFCPIGSFAGVEVYSHVVVRPRATTVVVRHGPPRVEVVRRRSKVKVITVSPRKVSVHSHNHNFVRVEPSVRVRSRVTVPVGQQYRHRRPHHRSSTVTVESTGAQRKKTVTVQSSRPAETKSVTVETRPRSSVTVTKERSYHSSSHHGAVKKSTVTVRSSTPVRKKTVRVKSNRDDDDHHEKVKVKVRSR